MKLSDQIGRELTAMLANDQPMPFKLTLTGISSHFGVSPMPVRQAVDQLIADGLLRKLDNGRIEPDPDAVAALSEVDVEVAGDQPPDPIEQRIADEVVMRSLTREEHYLREAVTAEGFGVGRTVVRRVFGHLAGQGLLEHVPRCGWLVRPYREKDMLDYLDIRETLEVKALRLARDRLDPAMLQSIREGNHPGGRGKPVKLDNRLHAYWIEQSGNRYIADFFEKHGAFYSAMFDYAVIDKSVQSAMARQHIEVLDALLAGDHRGAVKALVRHIRAQQPNVAGLIDNLTRKAAE